MFLNTGLSELVDERYSLTEIKPADAKSRIADSNVNFSIGASAIDIYLYDFNILGHRILHLVATVFLKKQRSRSLIWMEKYDTD